MAREPFNRIWTETPTVDDFYPPTETMWKEGWRGGADQDPPEAYAQNWWQNRVDNALQDIERRGAMEWHADSEYEENAISISPMGDLYSSQSTDNVGNDPDVDGGINWLRIAFGRATDSVFGFFRKATQAEVDDGSTDEAAVTPEKLRFGVSFSIGENGYLALPSWLGGLIIQWGSQSLGEYTGGSGNQNTDFEFPTPFPGSVFQVIASVGPGQDSRGEMSYTAEQLSNSGFVFVYAANGGANPVGTYIAIGN